ncbi:Helicase conserved C-terminal domain-containing protein [Prosthecobacter debontii]|uniref:Helicase conserved C-terminal domain-containing protein n=1 Tax=Prosthecobacter debontii TaxID=48467 RepID=A0A1T4Z052_9BACT|nr:DEAD/DEAH box helicase [Prosthecobacter debontii]SKB07188.1 Helicase conserved C-terminal domain-containing protein [Prosthecobacter debontii]
MSSHPLLNRLPTTPDCTNDELLGRFLDYVTERGLELYPAQEEAILELFEEKNVILNTPTGSGKSLVATALHFRSLARRHRSIYTCPIKALVNEKFLALCRDFGPENVGMATGDATVNRDAPILCCTAEILANYALREGEKAPFTEVIMDEFHYYSDHERGVAWQVPLLTMRKSQFLLISATLGSTDFFQRELTKLTGQESVIISSQTRPVPLEFSYAETSVDVTLQDLVAENKTPVYLVHFTQNEAAQAAQDLMSLNFCSQAEKGSIKEMLVGEKFTSPYGKEVKKYLQHGVGIHHAGLLPKYRMLVEKLAQRGLLKVICGTDTLGVGVNVPIRTVLLTRLSKYGGQKVATLSARDFHQITGRAGRRGYDDIGFVVAQAPEHIIENAKMEAKAAGDAKKLRKMVKKKAPEGFVGWNADTFKKLQSAAPEPLVSRFQVSHGMMLQVLSREGDGCAAMRQLIQDSHESAAAKKQHEKRAWQLFRALVERKIISIIPPKERQGSQKLKLNVELQDDFSLNHTLSLYLIDALKLIDPNSATYAADILTLCESILENPDLILRRQLSQVKDEAMAAMKEEGIPYEERIARLEELEYPKPCRDFIYSTFNEFAALHPWVGQENIRPKSIVREMFENFRSFTDYIHDYELHRTEGVLLRHLSSVHKVLSQTVPESFKTEPVQEMEAWLAGVLRGTDSSLLDEWERLRNPDWQPEEKPEEEEAPDITRNKREFTALIRTEIFRFLRSLSQENYPAAIAALGTHAAPWTADTLAATLDPYYTDHDRILLDNEARNGRYTFVEPSEDQKTWKVSQVLVDLDGLNDWQAIFTVDLAQAREDGKPTLRLESVGPVA